MHVHIDEIIVELVIDGETITTTPEHPFFTPDGEWVLAGELRVGDRVVRADGIAGTVEATTSIHAPQVMYNLTVGAAHTFFVGHGDWLVHNVECSILAVNSQYSDPETGFGYGHTSVQVGDDIIGFRPTELNAIRRNDLQRGVKGSAQNDYDFYVQALENKARVIVLPVQDLNVSQERMIRELIQKVGSLHDTYAFPGRTQPMGCINCVQFVGRVIPQELLSLDDEFRRTFTTLSTRGGLGKWFEFLQNYNATTWIP